MKHRKPDRTPDQQLDELFAEIDFRWKVRVGGHRWEYLPYESDGLPIAEKDWLLTDGTLIGTRLLSELYLPLEVGELYRKFADLPPNDRKAICTFADEFGLLGDSVRAALPIPEGISRGFVKVHLPAGLIDESSSQDKPVRALGTGERLKTWREAILSMKRAVELHRLIRLDDVAGLKKLFRYRNREWTYERSGDGAFYSKQIDRSDLALPPDDVQLAARICLQRWINQNLDKYAALQMLWDVPTNKHVFRLMPKILLGAIWLQFARVVVGHVTYRPCKVCGKLLTISPEKNGFRVDREFCGAVCRQRDHRRKVREAKQLKKNGKSAREIAKHFETSLDTIKRWLNKER